MLFFIPLNPQKKKKRNKSIELENWHHDFDFEMFSVFVSRIEVSWIMIE